MTFLENSISLYKKKRIGKSILIERYETLIGINQYMRISEFLNWIRNKRNDANTLYVIEEDLSCSDIAITVKIDGQDKVLSLQDVQSLGMSMDISTNVVLGPNRYPTYSFVDGKANELISFIQQQFNVR